MLPDAKNVVCGWIDVYSDGEFKGRGFHYLDGNWRSNGNPFRDANEVHQALANPATMGRNAKKNRIRRANDG